MWLNKNKAESSAKSTICFFRFDNVLVFPGDDLTQEKFNGSGLHKRLPAKS